MQADCPSGISLECSFASQSMQLADPLRDCSHADIKFAFILFMSSSDTGNEEPLQKDT